MYVMHNSEYHLSCFALFENGPCLVADTNFDVLMVKLKGFFQSAKASKIETRGTRYQYCDFLVKVGTVTMGPSARGISVEVSPRWTRADVVKGLALQIPATLNAGRYVCLPDCCLQSSYASLPCIFYPFFNHLGML